MTTTPTEPQRSRLAPEPMARRDFLGLSALWSAGAAFALAVLGMIRLPKAAVLASPSKRFHVTLPESLGEGEAFVPPGRSVAVYRDRDGVYAISTVCTHLGCIVKPATDGFHCPCHGSRFASDGTVISGPAPKPLPWLQVADAGGGKLVVDEQQTVPLGEKVLA